MFKSIAKKSVALALALPLVAQAQSKTLSLEDRVAELEAGASLQNLKVGGFLETYATQYKFEDPAITNPIMRETSNTVMRLRAGLDINVDVSSRTKFYSRLAASKFMNTTSGAVTPTGFVTNDAAQGRDWTGSQLYLEKAYADISISPELVFSFGRLPTVDGPPLNYQLDRPRMGTYPTMARNSILDGLALTYNKTVGEGHELTTRVIYTPLSYLNTSTPASGAPAGSTVNYIQPPVLDGKEDSVLGITALMLEYKKQGGPLAKSFNVIYMGTKSGDIKTASTLYWTYFINTLTVMADGVAGSNFDLAVSHLNSEIENKGVGIGGNGYGGKAGEKVHSNATLAAMRYHFSSNTSLNAEYMWAGKNYFLYNVGVTNLTNQYNTPGTYSNIYVTHRLLSELTGRLGVAQQNYNWTTLALGPGSESNRRITTYEAMLRLDF